MRMNKWMALVLAMLLIGALALAEGASPAKIGEAAPDFEIGTLDGETIRLSDYRGKVVFLNEWATWCPPCVAEIPDIQKLADAHPDDLMVIGINLDGDEDETVRAFVEENGVTYTIAMDRTYEISAANYPSEYIPYSIFITPDGVVSSFDVGMLTYEEMVDRFDRAAGAK